MGKEGLTQAEATTLLNKHSGIMGISGVSSDMRTLLASDDPRAAFALELFCYRIARELGSSPSTVRTQLQTVYRRLGVHSRTQLQRALCRSGPT